MGVCAGMHVCMSVCKCAMECAGVCGSAQVCMGACGMNFKIPTGDLSPNIRGL